MENFNPMEDIGRVICGSCESPHKTSDHNNYVISKSIYKPEEGQVYSEEEIQNILERIRKENGRAQWKNGKPGRK